VFLVAVLADGSDAFGFTTPVDALHRAGDAGAMRLNAFHTVEYELALRSTGKALSNMQRLAPSASMRVIMKGR
jgi:hypothetical protein